MTLGQSLIAARKAAGISLEQLSAQTNIRPSLLAEFEKDNFSNAGGDTYARGHLRNIAKVLNTSAEKLLSQYDEEHAQVVRNIHDALVENNATFAMPERSKISQKQLMIFSGVGIFLILIASLVVNNLKQSADSPKIKPTPTATASAKASPTPTASVTTTEPATTFSSGTGVEVKLTATNGSSWLFVSDKGGTTLYSGRATQGQSFIFSSTEIVNLRIGNAGAVKLTVNGKEVAPLGGNGEVVNVSYGVNS